MKHLTTNEVFQFIDDAFANGEKSRLIAHLEVCETCRREVERCHRLERTVREMPTARPAEGFTTRVLNRVIPDQKKSWVTRLINNLGNIIAMALVLTVIWYALSSTSTPKDKVNPSASSRIYSTYVDYYVKVRDFASAELGKLIGDPKKEPLASVDRTVTLTLISILILVGVDRLVGRRIVKVRS
jgi:hypothetical protein